jgi:hypothetical protein
LRLFAAKNHEVGLAGMCVSIGEPPVVRGFFQLQRGLPDGLVVQGQNTITLIKRYDRLAL